MATKIVRTTTRRRRSTGFDGFGFNREMVEQVPGLLGEYRARAWEVFEGLPYPNTRDEAWRRTDIRGLDGSFTLPDASLEIPPVPAALANGHPGSQALWTPAGVQVDLREELAHKGVIFSDLETAARKHPEIVSQVLGKIVRPEDGKFAALAAALSRNGVFVYVPKGVQLDTPLQSLIWVAGAGQAHFSQLVIWVDDGASLTYVHETTSPDEGGEALYSGIVEIQVGAGAQLRFVELQSLGKQIWNFAHERARVDRHGDLDWIFGAIGSKLTKSFTDLDLVGPGASGRLSGFYFADDHQHLDHDTQQNHLAPHTTSDLLYKGALKGNSRSVWQGMIYVAPGAQRADGYQANRNLILSSEARADSIPGLEILADDVRCTHGATVGKIDPDQVFYLRTRGIPIEKAERLIVEGFFSPIMERIPFEGVRARYQKAIVEKL